MKFKRLYVLITAISISLFLSSAFAESKLTNIKVRHDKRYDFSQINENYTWTRYESSANQYSDDYDEEIDELVMEAIDATLAAKGYSESDPEQASFGIDYGIVLEEEGSALSHVRRGSGRNPYTYVNVEGMPSIKDWRKGTLILNIVNLKTGYVIWVGHADALVVDKKNREQLVQQAVSQMLDKFPP